MTGSHRIVSRSMLVVILVATLGPVGSSARAGERTVRGDVLVPAAAAAARCAWLTEGERSQGLTGFMIKIGARDGDNHRPFTLRAVDPPLYAPNGVVNGPRMTATFFGRDLGTCHQPSPVLGMAAAHPVAHGRLPWGTRHALVTLHVGATPRLLGCYALLPWCVAWLSIELPAKAGAHSFVFRIRR